MTLLYHGLSNALSMMMFLRSVALMLRHAVQWHRVRAQVKGEGGGG